MFRGEKALHIAYITSESEKLGAPMGFNMILTNWLSLAHDQQLMMYILRQAVLDLFFLNGNDVPC